MVAPPSRRPARTRLASAAILLFALAAYGQTAPPQDGKLVLLVRGDDAWLAKAMEHDAVARAVASMSVVREPGKRSIAVLDQGGDELLEPGSAFRNINQFAVTLASLNHNAGFFASSAKLRAEGHLAESILVRANGLLRSGERNAAHDAFEAARREAEKEHDELLAQRARVSIAGFDLSSSRSARGAVAELDRIAKHPLANDVAATAWLLLGHYHKLGRRREDAIVAYQKAWRLADKPSPLAADARQYLEMMGVEPESDVAAAAATGEVHLVFARKPVMAGKIEVTASAPPSAARVEFYLDGARVSDDSSAPFAATIALGSAPRVHTIKAAAFDVRNAFLGEESAMVNEVVDALSVSISAPAAAESQATIFVEPRAPGGVSIESVELYWGDGKLATLTAPPYRYELKLPSRNAAGYVRAVARDSSGATAEDVRMINAPAAAEEMRVDLVEVYAIVQERGGPNVEGLTARDFVVKEDGAPVEVELRGTPNDPIAAGFVLDTSASMRPLMVDVAEDATTFVSSSLAAGDQAFVVAFAERPQLVQPLTSDLKHVTASILDIDAGGGTSVWDSLIVSLQQLRSVKGKRALLLFTDGADTTSNSSAATALAVAREVGVPVYVFLMRSGSPVRPPDVLRLQGIANDTGGAMFKSPRKSDLPRLFTQIRDDTRGEYLLSYTSKSPRPRTQMRTISVSVPGRDVVVRAMSGYYPR